MYLGKPVIATGYSGNLDFMTEGNSLLVDYRLVPIGPGAPPYPADGEWAEPDVEHAAELMRLVFDDRAAAAALGERAAEDIRRHTPRRPSGELMNDRLEHLRLHPTLRHYRRRRKRFGAARGHHARRARATRSGARSIHDGRTDGTNGSTRSVARVAPVHCLSGDRQRRGRSLARFGW